jgi:Rha family phage regulatory protein
MNTTILQSNTVTMFEKSQQFWTTSMDIAENFNRRHDNVIQAINKIEKFLNKDALFFKEMFYTDTYGREQRMYEISRDGFSLLVMGFTGKKALCWKLKYIEAFNLLERQLHRRASPEWQQVRQQGKVLRLQATDAIQELVAHAKNQGSKNAEKYYMLITRMEYKALFYIASVSPKPESIRDMLNELQLSNLATAEGIISKVIRNSIQDALYYKDIYKLCKVKIEDFVGLVGITTIPAAESMLGHNSKHMLEFDGQEAATSHPKPESYKNQPDGA